MEKKIKLRPIQTAVIESEAPHLVVVAGAGAGKTSVLVQRYLRFVRAGAAPSSILSITFTRKAAAEMKHRIVAALRSEGYLEAAQEAETGPIQTVHSFCERLLRENAIAAGLDPQFEILGDAQKADMRERAIRAALGDPPDDATVRELLHRLAGEPSAKMLGRETTHARLEEAVLRFIEEARGAGMSRTELLDLYGNADSVLHHWRSVIRGNLAATLGEHLPSDVFDKDQISASMKAVQKPRPAWSRAEASAEALHRAATYTSGLVLLGCEAWRLLEADMVARQALDFTALEGRAVQLLEGSEEVRWRISHAYKVVMVDEAQDLNLLQHRLLNKLSVPNRLFVGDPYQSIYGWRQADYRLFRALAEEGPRSDLNENHRSTPGILAFVELLFSRIWGDDKAYRPMVKPDAPPISFLDDAPPLCENVEIWTQSHESIRAIAERLRELRCKVGPDPSMAVLVRRSFYANELLSHLNRIGVPAKIVGGTDQYYTRLEVRDVANCLRALADPYDDFALLATLRSPIAGLSLDAVALLGLDKPVVRQLATFVSPVPDDAPKIAHFLAWFIPLSSKADRVPASEILSEVFAVSGYWEALAGREQGLPMLANVRKLLKLAAEAPEQDAFSFAEQIRNIQRMNHKESDAPAESAKPGEITILTVHKAKGLEWDIVVVPDLLKAPNTKEDVEVEPALSLVTARFSGEEVIPQAFAKSVRLNRSADEERRVLYVALTRARDRLILVADPKAKHGSLAKLVADQIGLGRLTLPGVTVEKAE